MYVLINTIISFLIIFNKNITSFREREKLHYYTKFYLQLYKISDSANQTK